MRVRVFTDSDVVISSLISDAGAAYALIHDSKAEPTVSNYSITEIRQVNDRLNIPSSSFNALIHNFLSVTQIDIDLHTIKNKYGHYVKDKDDSHIIAGAVRSHAQFVATYNLKDYNIELIRRDAGIITTTPGNILQYLRSIDLI